jgi:ATP-dependent Clp protease adapter protein ClpS
MMPPIGWMILAISSYAMCVASFAASVSRGGYLLISVAIGFGLLGHFSVRARRASRRRHAPSPILSPETTLLKRDGFLTAGFRCGVEILNDNTTPMEFVVSVLQSHLGLDRNEATKTMLEIHNKGGILLPMDSLDESRHIAELIGAKARASYHPLICRALSVE